MSTLALLCRAFRHLLLCVGLLGGGSLWADPISSAAGAATCHGKFMNPITDVCWDCIFPISLGSLGFSFTGQEDNDSNPGSPFCACPMATPPFVRIGLSIGFWEPARTIEVTRTPFCFPSLNGLVMPNSFAGAPWGGRDSRAQMHNNTRGSFYQVHYYANPILYMLELLLDTACLEAGSFDLAYMTEFDPTWHDDVLAMILAPESVLVSNIVAIAACTADCVAASAGFGIKELFWCSGCNGITYPLNGDSQVQLGGVQNSAMLVHRMLAKQHRQLTAWQWWGSGALCHGHPAPLLDKTGYKSQIIYPIPMTNGTDGTGFRRCCQPLGRTTQIYGMAREFPIRGEDFSYLIFRKRNCCMF